MQHPVTYNFIFVEIQLDHLVVIQTFLRTHKIGLQWSDAGEIMLPHDRQILLGSIDTTVSGPQICTRGSVDLPARPLVVFNAKTDIVTMKNTYVMFTLMICWKMNILV